MNNKFRQLKLSIYTPIILGIFFITLNVLSKGNSLDFNRLFSIMTPLQTVGGMLLGVGLELVIVFRKFEKEYKSNN